MTLCNHAQTSNQWISKVNRPTMSSSKHLSIWIQLHPIVPARRFIPWVAPVSSVISKRAKAYKDPAASGSSKQTSRWSSRPWYRDSWDRTLTTHRWKERTNKHFFDMNGSPMVWCTMMLTLCGSDDFEQKLTPSRTPTRSGPRYSIMEQEDLPNCHDNLNSHSMVFAPENTVEWTWTPGVH